MQNSYSFALENSITAPDIVFRMGIYSFPSECWSREIGVPEHYLTRTLLREDEHDGTCGGKRQLAGEPLQFMPAFVPARYGHAPRRLRVAQCIFDSKAFARVTGIGDVWTAGNLQHVIQLPNQRLRDLMIQLEREVAEPGFDSVIMAESLGRVAMLELARHFRRHAGLDKRGRLTDRQLGRITTMIHETCGNGSTPSIAEIASVCGISASHLMRSFRSTTGSTLLQFIDEVRLAKAKNLLINSALPLKCIAGETGFANASRFSERFRHLTGEQPSQFRARNRGSISRQ